MESPLPRLETPRVLLRTAVQEDAPAIVDYYRVNQEHLRGVEPLRSPEFYMPAHWEKAIQNSDDAYRADRSLKLFVFLKDSPDRVIGAVEYSNFSRGPFQACNLGYSIGAGFQGKGLMSEALRAANRFIFETLGFHRIMANYLPGNERSGLLLKRLGFQVEGYARDYLKIQGAWRDHILTSLVHPGDASAAALEPVAGMRENA